MASKTPIKLHERRKGESALSEFADYVEKQQAKRYPHNATPATSTTAASSTVAATPSTTATTTTEDDQTLDELDELLDGLDFSDKPPQIPMRQLLLGGETENNIDDGDEENDNVKALSTLLSERIAEGSGETVLDVGFEHSGEEMGLTRAEWDVALSRVRRAAERAGAACEVLLTRNVGGEVDVYSSSNSSSNGNNGSNNSHSNNNNSHSNNNNNNTRRKDTGCTGKVMVRRRPKTVEEVIETRIAVVGNVDAGKSSLLGVLVRGELDDGRGRARVNLFRHKHEFETGRTSSVGMEILGFDAQGEVVRGADAARKLSWEEIGRRSAKVITFTDLAGHERYLRTTMFGMMATAPNYCLLMVAANNGLIGMSKEHLGIALALNVPVLVVVTKTDICPPNILAETMTQITKVLRSPGARKVPVLIQTREECVATATQLVSQRVCPVFQVSNVTGQHLDLVRTFLNILPPQRQYDDSTTNADGTMTGLEFHVNDTYSVPFVGTVVSGIVRAGVAHAGDPVWIGPDANGNFAATVIRSIERKRIGVPAASAGQSASFALKKMRRKDVRKGQVVLQKTDEQPKVYREFVAEVLILSHATTIKPKYQATLHVGPVSQTCAIIDMDRPLLRTGQRAQVAFRFIQRPEFLAPGDRLLFREGRTKGLGIVQSVGYDSARPLQAPQATTSTSTVAAATSKPDETKTQAGPPM